MDAAEAKSCRVDVTMAKLSLKNAQQTPLFTFDFTLQLTIGKSQVAQPFGTRALKKFQVLGVVYDTTGVGIFKVDPLRKIECKQRGLLGVFK